MIAWIENWLIVGLFISWIGLMFQRYWRGHPDFMLPPTTHWKWEIVGIAAWPFALALGFVMSRIERNRKKQKK